MKLRFLNISPIVLSAILSTRLLAVEETEQSPELETRVSKLEKKMKQVRTETALGTYTATSASADPQNEGYGLFVTADLVVWKLYEGSNYQDITNTNFTSNAQTSNQIRTSTGIVSSRSTDVQKKNLDFKWDCGFKAGVGYVMAHDSWDAYFNYTQFRTHASKSTNQVPLPTTAFQVGNTQTGAVLNFQDPIPSNNSAKAKRKIDLYMADLELGKSFFITKYFSTRPFIGAKTAWIHQKLTSENDLSSGGNTGLTSAQLATVAAAGITKVEIDGRNNFWGIGPRVGIGMNWFFARCFNLYSNVSGAILWGNFKVHQNETATAQSNIIAQTSGVMQALANINSITSPFTNEIKASPHRFVPTIQFEMGIEFNVPFSDNAYNFSMKAGYENQYWWRQNFLANLSYFDINNPGDFNGIGGVIVIPTGININAASQVVIEDIQPDPRLDSPDDLGFHGLTIEFRLDF